MVMVRIQKWRNSLALRIPKKLAADAQISEGTYVELSVENECLIVLSRRKDKRSFKDLLAKITPENLHNEIDTTLVIGREVW